MGRPRLCLLPLLLLMLLDVVLAVSRPPCQFMVTQTWPPISEREYLQMTLTAGDGRPSEDLDCRVSFSLIVFTQHIANESLETCVDLQETCSDSLPPDISTSFSDVTEVFYIVKAELPFVRPCVTIRVDYDMPGKPVDFVVRLSRNDWCGSYGVAWLSRAGDSQWSIKFAELNDGAIKTFSSLSISSDRIVVAMELTNPRCVRNATFVVCPLDHKDDCSSTAYFDPAGAVGVREMTANDLQPCTNYLLSLRLLTGFGAHDDKVIQVMTDTEAPGKAVKLEARDVSWTSVDLSWEVIPAAGSACVPFHYVVTKSEYDHHAGGALVASNTSTVVVLSSPKSSPTPLRLPMPGLQPCRLFQVTVTPLGAKGRLGESESPLWFFTFDDSVEAAIVSDVKVEAVDASTLSASWALPTFFADLGRCIDGYEARAGPQHVRVAGLSANISGLAACREYDVQVAVLYYPGDRTGPFSKPAKGTPLGTRPGPVQGLEAFPSPRSMVLRWLAPSFGGDCVVSYNVSVWSLDQGSAPDDWQSQCADGTLRPPTSTSDATLSTATSESASQTLSLTASATASPQTPDAASGSSPTAISDSTTISAKRHTPLWIGPTPAPRDDLLNLNDVSDFMRMYCRACPADQTSPTPLPTSSPTPSPTPSTTPLTTPSTTPSTTPTLLTEVHGGHFGRSVPEAGCSGTGNATGHPGGSGGCAEISDLHPCSQYLVAVWPFSKSGSLGESACLTVSTGVEVPTADSGQALQIWRTAMRSVWTMPRNHKCVEIIASQLPKSLTLNVRCEGGGDSMRAAEEAPTLGPRGYEILVSGLRPGTAYECRAMFVYSTIESAWSNPLTITTLSGSDAPTHAKVDGGRLTWQDAVNSPGTRYEVVATVQHEPEGLAPKYCVKPRGYLLYPKGGQTCCDGLHQQLPGGTEFKFQVRALGGQDKSREVIYTTPEKEPGPPSMFYIMQNLSFCGTDFIDSIKLGIAPPCVPNGEITSYNVCLEKVADDVTGDTGPIPPLSFQIDTYFDHDSGVAVFPLGHYVRRSAELDFRQLQNHSYRLRLAAHSAAGAGIPVYAMNYLWIPKLLPPVPKEAPSVSLDPADPRRRATVHFRASLFNESLGAVDHYALLVSPVHQDDVERNAACESVEGIRTWRRARAESETDMPSYQATPPYWDPFAGLGNETDSTDEWAGWATFHIGEHSDCLSRPEWDFCNGPLQPGTNYSVSVIAVSDGLGRFVPSPAAVFSTTPDSEGNETMMAVGLMSLSTIAFAITLTVIVSCIRRCSLGRCSRAPRAPKVMAVSPQVAVSDNYRGGCRASCASRVSRSAILPHPYKLGQFRELCACALLDECNPTLRNEFEMLCALSAQYAASTASRVGSLPHNASKNRYCNIVPFDKNRVRLRCDQDDEIADYINASFITGFTGKTEYIATQGPKEETTRDFWFMVYEQKVRLIIMLTQLMENDKVKCHQYFPNQGDRCMWGDLVVGCSVVSDLNAYTLRTIVMHKGSEERLVHHLHFREWPDFGCPVADKPILQFCTTMRQHASLFPGMILVHCSAGVGRTGTLLALDILLQTIKAKKRIDIFGVVMRLREQRSFMVQSQAQYSFIYNCLKAALEDPQNCKSKVPCPFKSSAGKKQLNCLELPLKNDGKPILCSIWPSGK